MRLRVFERKEYRKIIPIYLANLFVSLHYAAVLYINSSNLEEFFASSTVSALFILGALLNILLFILAPRILRKVDNRALVFVFILLEGLSIFGLAVLHTPLGTALSFLLHAGVMMMVYYCLDLFLEDSSTVEKTGEIRGFNLTVGNIAIACGPLLVSFFTPDGDFTLLYFVSTILLVPALFIVFFYFKKLRIASTARESAFKFKIWFKEKNIRRVTLARLVLEVFYSVMVIYTPIYLHNSIGFSWSEIGLIFAVMLLPFVLFELPVGELADHWSIEKEIMTIGFFIMGVSLLVIPFLDKNIWVWMVVLFASRIGASFVEVSSESFFFRHVWKADTGLISIFRLTRPVSIILGSAVGALCLLILPFKALFLVLSILVFFGTQLSALLRETRLESRQL
jgi:MFS family permease